MRPLPPVLGLVAPPSAVRHKLVGELYPYYASAHTAQTAMILFQRELAFDVETKLQADWVRGQGGVLVRVGKRTSSEEWRRIEDLDEDFELLVDTERRLGVIDAAADLIRYLREREVR